MTVTKLCDVIAAADWKTEKHVPVIDVPGEVQKGKPVAIKVCVGYKDLSHPNTTEHHIKWIDVHFKPEGGKFPFHLGRAEFGVHGESTLGPNQGPVHTEACMVIEAKFQVSGTIMALAYCNIHGLWEHSTPIKVE